jgi:predicted dehydrogenase
LGQDSKTIRLAFIGIGYWGPNLLRSFIETEGCEVAGVSDLKPGRLAFVRARYPHLRTTSDYREFLDDPAVDAVCVATRVSAHHAVVKDALLAGKHVLVTKPMADSTAKAAEIVELASRQKRKVLVDHTFVFSSPVRKIRELIQTGELGRICYADLTRMNLGPPAPDLDVAWDFMPHDISILLHWFGEAPQAVSAQGWHFVRKDFCDVAMARLEFAGGRFARIHASWLSPQKVRQAYIFAERKMVIYDHLDPIAPVKVFGEAFDNRVGGGAEAAIDLKFGRGDILIPALAEGEPLKNECAHFVRALTTGERLVSGAEMGLDVVRILEAVSASMKRDGETVRLASSGTGSAPS